MGTRRWTGAARWIATTTALLLLCSASLAFAAPGDVVRVQLTQYKVTVDAQGVEKFETADKSKPGDVLEYRAVYVNSGATAVTRLQASLPIPGGTDWIAGAAAPSGAAASLDGRTFEPIPLKRRVTRPDGTTAQEAVPYSAYRYLRWTIPELAAGKSVTVTARVRVQNGGG